MNYVKKLVKLADRFEEIIEDIDKDQESVSDLLDMRRRKAEQGNWVPANGGTETPFYTRSGRRLLYCWQPSTGKHAYLDLDTDIFLSDDEAYEVLSI